MDSSTFVLLFTIALIPAALAKSKGRSFILWYIYGVLFWIIAMIHSLLISADSAKGMVECPYCAELIKKDAKVCKHCGREV